MGLNRVCLAAIAAIVLCANGYAADAKPYLGKHLFALQWISDWDKEFGTAVFSEQNGAIILDAKEEKDGDYATVEGSVEIISDREFILDGKVVTKVSYINGGEPCERFGKFRFKANGGRVFWRMQQVDNPCDNAADYLDIFFGIEK